MVSDSRFMKDKVELRTERLLLRRYQRSDIPALLPLIGAREVAAQTLRIPHPYTEADARMMLHRFRSEGAHWFGIFLQPDEQLCGGAGLTVDQNHNRAEIGYWVGVPFWGQGIASEAARELMRYGFEDLKLHRIYAVCYTGNDASIRILEKFGMKHEGHSRQHFRKWGEYRDAENYGILADEWRAGRL
ncbi:MAG TPA: GNAT family protein [Terriglobales bacterium]|nr:GNAT family protein [Terriglobales bacterium]